MKTYILIERGEVRKANIDFDIPLYADLKVTNVQSGEVLGLGVVCLDYGSNTISKNKTKTVVNKIGGQ